MSQNNPADSDAVAGSDQEIIDVPDDSASQSAGNKRAPGRPASDAWNNFKRILNPNPGNSKSKYLGVCKDCGQKVTAKPEDLRKHASNCRKSSKETKMASQVQQIKYVDDTRIDSSVPFSAKEFDLYFTGSAEQVELPNMDFGVNTNAYDLNELL